MSEDRHAVHPDEQRFSLYVLDALDADEVAAFEAHIRACSACEGKLVTEAQLEVSLLAAARELTHVPLASRRPRASRSALAGGALVAAAAAVVLFVRLGDHPSTTPPIAKPGAALPAPQSGSEPESDSVTNVDVSAPCLVATVEVGFGSKVKRGQVVLRCDTGAQVAELAGAVGSEVAFAERDSKRIGELYKIGAVTSRDLAKAMDVLARARAKAQTLSHRIEQAKVRAPIDGTVLEVRAQVGDALATGTTVMKITKADLVRTDPPALRAAGYVAARSPSTVGMPVSGRLAEVKVENNTKVKRGQIVASLDASAALAERGQAAAEISVAEENLKTKRMLYKAQVNTIVDVHQAEGQVALARAKLYPINQRIEQAKLRSPIDGIVLEILAHPGDALVSAAPIMKVADLSHMVAEVEINESDIVKVFPDQEVEGVADSFPDHAYKGRVREIASQADKAKGTVLVKVDLDVPDQSLRPGMAIKGLFLPQRANLPARAAH